MTSVASGVARRGPLFFCLISESQRRTYSTPVCRTSVRGGERREAVATFAVARPACPVPTSATPAPPRPLMRRLR